MGYNGCPQGIVAGRATGEKIPGMSRSHGKTGLFLAWAWLFIKKPLGGSQMDCRAHTRQLTFRSPGQRGLSNK